MGSLSEFAFIILFSLAVAFGAYALAARRVFARAQNLCVSNERANQILWSLFFLYVIVFSGLSVLRHATLHSDWDLSIFDNTLWNSLHGRLFETTTMRDTNSFLGHHFSPILLALIPFYSILPDARVLLIVQPVILATTVLPVYWFARAQLGRGLALLVAISLFLFPALEYVTLYDFHEIAIATPILAFATFFLLRRRYVPMLVCLAVALLVKEEIPIIVAAFGVFIFLFQRKRWLGLALAIFGVAAFFFFLQIALPFFYGGEYYFVNRYGALGKSVIEILQTIVTQPAKVIDVLMMPGKVSFVLHLLVPLAFAPFLGIEIIFLALPSFGYLLLADSGVQTSIRSQYSAALIPFLYFAAIVGVRRMLTQDQLPRRMALATLLLVASLMSYYLHAPGPLSRNFPRDPSPIAEFPNASAFTFDARARDGRALIARVPPAGVVMTETDMMAQFSNRQFIYEFPTLADYRQAEFLFAEKHRFWYNLHKPIWDAWLATGYFEIVGESENFLLAKRRAPERALQIAFGDQITCLGVAIPRADTLRGGMTLRPVSFWRADRKIKARYKFLIQLVDARGHLWAEEEREPHDGALPTNQWQIGQTIGEQFTLRLPVTMPPGEYQIVVSVRALENEEIFLATLDALGNRVERDAILATVNIAKNKEPFTASDLAKEQPLVAQFADWQEIRLLGFVPVREQITAGEELSIGLYWKARAQPQGDYQVAIQLRDAFGKIALERAARPVNDAYPTTRWDAGEVLLDWHDLVLPNDLTPGAYAIWVVLRDAATIRVLGESRIAPLSVVK